MIVSFTEAKEHLINGGKIKVVMDSKGYEKVFEKNGNTTVTDTEIYFGEWHILD